MSATSADSIVLAAPRDEAGPIGEADLRDEAAAPRDEAGPIGEADLRDEASPRVDADGSRDGAHRALRACRCVLVFLWSGVCGRLRFRWGLGLVWGGSGVGLGLGLVSL